MPLKPPNYTLLTENEIELDGFQSQKRRWSTRNMLKWALPSIIGVCLVLALILNRSHSSGREFPGVGNQAACPQYPAIKAQSSARIELEADIASALSSDAFFEASTQRLQGAVQIPTESFDDMGLVGEDSRWDVFVDFHAYLEKTFPLV